MAVTRTDQGPPATEVSFPDGNTARMVHVARGVSPQLIKKSLGIEKEPNALILVIGGAENLDDEVKPVLAQLLAQGIAPVAAEVTALIIDGGTRAGIMELVGEAIAFHGHRSDLLGVAPSGKVTYPGMPTDTSKTAHNGAPLDHNHSHFVLVDSDDWGGETETMYDLARAFADEIPALTLLVGGGEVTKSEALLSVRNRWPIVLLQGTGGLADSILKPAGDQSGRNNKPGAVPVEDPALAEIRADGNLRPFPLNGSVEDLQALLYRILNPILNLAWERFATYDDNATLLQKNFKKMQGWILALGVVATAIVVSQTQFQGFLTRYPLPNLAIRDVVIVLPITISVLVAFTNRFGEGNKWILLRASAEAMKREIYRFRTRTGPYGHKQGDGTSGESSFAQSVQTISRSLMQTEVNDFGLKPYKGKIPPKMYGAAENDDGFSSLTPERYVAIRLGDQLSFYQGKADKLEKRLRRYQWLIYVLGGVGTFLAAIGLQLWIAVTTALVGVFTTYLAYLQVDSTLIKYNQAATDLANIRAWWTSLSARDKHDPSNFDKLVAHTEKILEDELTGWAQRMEDALAKLRSQEEAPPDQAQDTKSAPASSAAPGHASTVSA